MAGLKGDIVLEATTDTGPPDGVRYINHGAQIEIVVRWLGQSVLSTSALLFLWSAIFLIFSLMINPKDAGDILPLFVLYFSTVLGMGYYVLAGWLNHTHLLVNLLEIRVRHRPIPYPWFDNENLKAGDLKQLYAEGVEYTSHRGSGIIYEVRAITKRGEDIKIVGGLETPEQAIFIEQTVNKYLRIKDASTPGEIPIRKG